MNVRPRQLTKFLETIPKDDEGKLRRACEDLIESLPQDADFDPFQILNQARHRLQEEHLKDLAAMNASPFDSARD